MSMSPKTIISSTFLTYKGYHGKQNWASKDSRLVMRGIDFIGTIKISLSGLMEYVHGKFFTGIVLTLFTAVQDTAAKVEQYSIRSEKHAHEV